MNELITRAAGAVDGQEFARLEMEVLIRSAGRLPASTLDQRQLGPARNARAAVGYRPAMRPTHDKGERLLVFLQNRTALPASAETEDRHADLADIEPQLKAARLAEV